MEKTYTMEEAIEEAKCAGWHFIQWTDQGRKGYRYNSHDVTYAFVCEDTVSVGFMYGSVIITRKREAKNPFFSVVKAARTADEFANTYNEAVARMNEV